MRRRGTRVLASMLVVAVMIVTLFSVAVPLNVEAQLTGVETEITTNAALQRNPAIYGDRIVWTDYRNGNGDIYMYDLNTGMESQITTHPALQYFPDIYGDRIVWTDQRNGYYATYMYDLSTGIESQISTSTAHQYKPAIYGDRIVWCDGRKGNLNLDIYLYDLSTGTESQITIDTSSQRYPDIYGDRIVWTDYRRVPMDIYMYDLSTGTESQITTDMAYGLNPSIYGDRIVWEDRRNGVWNCDIYMYDLSTGTELQITTNPSNQMSPDIYGDRIVWYDWRNGNWDIFMYDLSTGTESQITTNPAFQVEPAIYGDKIVWTDRRNGNEDIYMYELESQEYGIIWQYGTTGVGGSDDQLLYSPSAVQMLGNGNYLISDTENCRVIEVDSNKNIVWQYGTTGVVGSGPNQLGKRAWNSQRLANGNTLITDTNNHRVIEVTPQKQIVWQYGITGSNALLYYPRDAERLNNGNTLISDTDHYRIIEVNSQGNIVWFYQYVNLPTDADRLPNGNTLISEPDGYRVFEVTPSKQIVWQYGTGVGGYGPGQIGLIWDADRLPNGNTLISDTQYHRVIEVTPGKQIVWQYGVSGIGGTGYNYLKYPWAAERLPDGSTLIADMDNHRVIRIGSISNSITISGEVYYMDWDVYPPKKHPVRWCKMDFIPISASQQPIQTIYSNHNDGEYSIEYEDVELPFFVMVIIYCESPDIVWVTDGDGPVISSIRFSPYLEPGQNIWPIDVSTEEDFKSWKIYDYIVLSYLFLTNNAIDSAENLDDDLRIDDDPWHQPEIQVKWFADDEGATVGPCNISKEYTIKVYERDEYGEDTYLNSSVPHEYGHAIMFKLYGDSYPDVVTDPTHDLSSEFDTTGKSFCEGWADFFAYVCNREYGRSISMGSGFDHIELLKFYDDNDTEDFDGEKVEGSVVGTLWDIYDDDFTGPWPDDDGLKLDDSFLKIWTVLLKETPYDICEFWDGWFALAEDVMENYEEMEKVYTYHGILRPAIKDLIHDAEVLKDEILEHQIFLEIEGQLNRIIDRLSDLETRDGDISKDKLYGKLDGVIEQMEGMKIKIETAKPNKVPEKDRNDVKDMTLYFLGHLKRIKGFIT